MIKNGVSVITFKTQNEFESWLDKNHKTAPGVWIMISKKGSGVITATYDELLEIALCYGWIDGLVNRFDEKYYIQKWTPRRKRSVWSSRNTGIVERLIKARRMKEAGLLEVERAKEDGRWANAYGSSSIAKPSKEFLDALEKNKKAKAFYETLNKANTYAIYWQIQNAKKDETKQRRIKKFIDMLSKGEKLY